MYVTICGRFYPNEGAVAGQPNSGKIYRKVGRTDYRNSDKKAGRSQKKNDLPHNILFSIVVDQTAFQDDLGSLTLCLPLDFHNPLQHSPLRLIFLSNFKIFLVIVCHCVV